MKPATVIIALLNIATLAAALPAKEGTPSANGEDHEEQGDGSGVGSGSSASGLNETQLSSGSKRGLVYNQAKLTHLFPSNVAGWGYNYASTPVASGFQGPFANGHEFVPMLYDGTDPHWDQNVQKALHSGSKHLLAMNEPDQSHDVGGTNISPQDAARIYKSKMNKYKGQARLGAPAISAGGISWLKSFAQACGGDCHIDFVPLHFYNGDPSIPVQVTSMKGWLQETIPQVRNMFKNPNMPIWVTEFAALPLDPSSQSWAQKNVQYMNGILPYLDGDQAIARYSYFYVDSLARGGHLNAAGKRYVKK